MSEIKINSETNSETMDDKKTNPGTNPKTMDDTETNPKTNPETADDKKTNPETNPETMDDTRTKEQNGSTPEKQMLFARSGGKATTLIPVHRLKHISYSVWDTNTITAEIEYATGVKGIIPDLEYVVEQCQTDDGPWLCFHRNIDHGVYVSNASVKDMEYRRSGRVFGVTITYKSGLQGFLYTKEALEVHELLRD